MSARRMFLAALALAACAGCGNEPTAPSATPTPVPSAVIALTSASFSGQVLGQGTTWLVEFYSPTCGHCQSMSATVERLAVDFRGRAAVGKVDASLEMALAETHRVEWVPTFVFFRNGREISRYVGATSYETLAEMLRAAETAK